MLSDHERKALEEVERQFMAQDPDFTRSFDDDGGRPSTYSLQRMYEFPLWAYRGGSGLALVVGCLMLLTGNLWTGLVITGLAAIIAAISKHRVEPGRPES